MLKNKKIKTMLTSLILVVISLSACNLPASTPAPTPIPNVDLSTALIVNTFRDTFDGVCDLKDCSLRDAVYQVQLDHSDGEIFLPSGLYKLNERIGRNDDSSRYGDLDISSKVTIQGEGMDISVIDGAHKDRIFHILNSGNLALHDMTLINGLGDDPPFVEPKSTVDTVLDCVFSLFSDCSSEGTIGNPSDFQHIIAALGGGAIVNQGRLFLDTVGIEANAASRGGGIYNEGVAEITGGRVCNNQGRTGGGIFNDNRANLLLTGVSVCDNNTGTDPVAWGPDFGSEKPGFQDPWFVGDGDWGISFNSDVYFYGGGGGIYNDNNAILTMVDSNISGNEANIGTALWNKGTATLDAVQIIENGKIENRKNAAIYNENSSASLTILGGNDFSRIASNSGPALTNYSKASITNTLILDNPSYKGGAVINLDGADLVLTQSLVSGNVGEYGPGGIGAIGGTVKLINVSIGENSGPTELNTVPFRDERSGMGAIYVETALVELLNVTIFNNNTPGLVRVGGRVSILNTILANNTGDNCFGSIISLGHNLDSEISCGLNVAGDLSSSDPGITLLADASTGFTYKIPANSLAHDAADLANCPALDQQEEPRPMGLGCDIGADEVKEIVGIPLEGPLAELQPTAVQPAQEVAPVIVVPSVVPSKIPPTSTTPPTITPLPPTETTPPDPQNASISGSVWNDSNGNGIKQSGEPGIAGQSVQLGSGSCNSTNLGSRSSDSGGGYSFTNLAAGTYCVSVVRTATCGEVTAATTPKSVTVVLQKSQIFTVIFGFQKVIC